VPPRVTNGPTVRWRRLSPGVRVRHLIDAEGTSLQLYQLEPGTRFELHEHDFPELGMVLSGKGKLTFDEGDHRAEAGDSFCVPGRMRHGFSVPDDGPPVLLINVEAANGTSLNPSLVRERPRMALDVGRNGEPVRLRRGTTG